MDLSSIWPTWGSQGEKPSDGKDYEQGDNVAAGSLDYLWYYIKDTFEKVETALSNKADDPHDNTSHSENYATDTEVSEKADDPHGNFAHDPAFLPSNNYDPVSDVEDETGSLDIDISGDADTVDGQDASQLGGSGVANPHGNGAHNPDFLPSNNYDPVGDVEDETSALNIDISGDADTVDGQDASQLGGNVSNPHGNSAHSTNFFPQANYDPVGDVEDETSALNIDISGDADTVDGLDASQIGGAPIPHGNKAHDPEFLPASVYDPVGDIEDAAGKLTIDITGDADTVDGNEASDFIKSGEELKIGTDEIYLEDPNLDTNGDGIDIFDVQSHFSDFESSSGTYRDLLQTVYAFETLNGNAPERDADGDIRLDAAVQSGFYTMTFGIRAPLSDSKIRIRGERIVMQNDAGDTVAKIDSDGNLDIAGTVNENAF